MAVFALKTASRLTARKAHFLTPKSTLRHHASTPPPAPKPTADPATSSIPFPQTVAPLPLWQRLGPLSRGFQAYGRSQRKRPYATQFVSSLVIYVVGDSMAQRVGGEEYDGWRTGRALVISMGSSIPSFKWFMFLNNNFNYSSKALSIATKVVVNQLVFTPIFNTYFFGMQSLLSGDTLEAVWERLRRTVPTSMLNSCKLWPAVTAFSFTFIDPQYRSLFAGVVSLGWQTYLSLLNRKAEVEVLHDGTFGEEKREIVEVSRECADGAGGNAQRVAAI